MNLRAVFRVFLGVVSVWLFISWLPAYAVSLNKAIVPSVGVNPGTATQLQLTVFNDAVSGSTNIPLTNVAFFDDLSAFTDQPGMKIANPANIVNVNCPGATITAVPGSQLISVTGMTVPAKVGAVNGRCDVYVDIVTTTQGNTVNTIPSGNLSNNESFSNAQAASATLSINTVLAPTLGMTVSKSTVYLGDVTKLTINVKNNASISLTNTAWIDNLPTGLQLSATPNLVTSGCTTPTISAPANGTVISLSNTTIAAGATCTITVDVVGNTQGNYSNSMAIGTITNNQGVTNGSAASQSVAVQSFNATKSFAPNLVKTNQVSTMTVTINSPTTYTNLAFTDDFSSQTGLVIASPANASTNCGSGSVTATSGTQALSLSGGTITGNNNFSVPASCFVKVDVVVPSNLNTGVKTNTLLAGSITGLSGAIPASNINDVISSLTVNPYVTPTITKAFATDPIFVGQNSDLTISVKNNDSVSFTNLGWTDILPSGLITNGTTIKSGGCTGVSNVSAPINDVPISLSNATIAAGATCTVTIPVTATQQGGPYTNNIPIGNITDNQGTSNTVAASAILNTVNTITASKSFAASPIAIGVPTTLTITIRNASTHAYNSLAFNDNFVGAPNTLTNLQIASTPNASTTCGTGVVTAVAGSQSVALSGGQILAGIAGTPATCTVTVDVVGIAAFASKANTIPIGGVTGVDAVNGTAASSYQAATANIAVTSVATPTITKTFSASPVFVGEAFNAVIAVKNNDASIALTNVSWTDTLPTGLKVNGTATKSAGCTGVSTINAPLNGVSIAFSAGTIATGATCTVTVPVVATQENQTTGFVNNMPINAVNNDQGAKNTVASSATVKTRAFTPTKTFNGLSSTTVHPNDIVTLKILISNNSTDSYNNLAFTDNLALVDANLKVASTPAASTTCGAGTVTAAGGSSTVSLSGGTIGAGTATAATTCYVQVNVTSTTGFASAANTLAIGAITGTAVSNGTPASSYAATTANLAVTTIANPTLAKSFSPNPVYVGQTSTLSISVTNNDALVSLTGVKWSDILPANLTMITAPVANAACGSPSLTTSGQTIDFGATTGGTIAVGATCIVTVDVTADRQSLGTDYLNSMAANAVTTNESTTSNSASSTLTVNTLKIEKTFDGAGTAPATAAVSNTGTIVKLRLTIKNFSTHAYNNIAFTDNFGTAPSTLPSTFKIATPGNLVNTCGGTVTATDGSRIVSLSGGALAAGSSISPTTCYIEVDTIGTANFTNQPNTIIGTNNNCFAVGALTANDTSNSSIACDKAGTTANLSLGSFSTPTLGKSFSPTTIYVGQNTTLTITVKNNDTSGSLTNVAWTDNLSLVAPGMIVNGAATASASCGSPTINAALNGTTISFSAGTILPSTTCTVTVPVTGTKVGSFTNRMPAGAITDSQSVTDNSIRNASLTVQSGLSLTKAFTPSTISAGGISTLTLTVSNRNAQAYTGLSVTDDLSTMTIGGGVFIAPTPNFATTCGAGTISYPTTQKFTFSGGSITAGTSVSPSTCTISVDVVGNISGVNKANTIPANALTVTEDTGQTNTSLATANLTVNAIVPTMTKTFSVTSIKNNGTDVSIMRITVTNPSTLLALSNIDVTDTFPAALNGLVIYSSPAAVNTCGGTLTATAGTNTLHLSGGGIAINSSCYVEVPVVSTLKFASSNNTATLNSASTPYQALSGLPSATAPIASTDNLQVVKTFGGAASQTINVGQKTQLKITITNDSAVAKTGLGFTDDGVTRSSFPSGRINVATPANLNNTCGGSVTTGTTSIVLTGGSIAALSSCSVTVDVVGVTTGGSQANTINTNNLTTTQGATNNAAASANITVTASTNIYNTVTKTYSPAGPITLVDSTRATISWKQTTATATVNPTVTDNLPAGLRVANNPNPSATCSTPSASPSVAATVNSISSSRDQIALTLTINQVQNQVCSVSFDVTPTAPGTTINTIRIGDIVSTNGASNTSASNNASMTVNNVMTIDKNFQPNQLGPNGISLLTINIRNPEALTLTNASLTDNLPNNTAPDNLVIANPANATTNCTVSGSPDASKVIAVPGTRTITLTGGVIPPKVGSTNGLCTITVYVKPNGAYTTGSSVNTIPLSSVTTAEGRTNVTVATDTITYVTPTLGAGKSFTPVSVQGGSVSKLEVTMINPQTYDQTGASFTDNMPAGMSIGLPPNPTSDCGGVFTNATVGSTSWSFSGGTIPANNGACHVSVNATMTVEGNLTNTIPVGGITTSNGATNSQKAEATLTNLAGASFGKSFSPNPIVVNVPTRLTINITNSSNIKDLTNMGFVDDLTRGGTQTGLTVATTPNISNTCNGTVTINPSRTSITLTGGSLPHSSVCSIKLDLIAATEGVYTNEILPNTLTNNETITNGDPSRDDLDVNSSIKVVKQLSPTTDAGKFNFTMTPSAVVGVSTRTSVGHDIDPTIITPFAVHGGTTYTITEIGSGVTDVNNYITTYVCKNADNTTVASGSGTSASVTPPASGSGVTQNQQAITCTFTNLSKQPTLTVNKISNGGVGSFTFTGNNGLPTSATTITTTTAGLSTTVAGLTNIGLTATGVETTITEGSLPGSFSLTSASCTGLQGTDTATLVGSTLTIPATSVIDGARISCTFVNTKAAAGVPLTINKTTVGGTGTFTFGIVNGASNSSVNVTTASAGTPVSSAVQTLPNIGSAATVTETPVAGWAVTAASCTDGTTIWNAAGTAVTIPPLVSGKTYACNFTNSKIGSSITGIVFKDSGTGSGTANNGTKEGTETGLPSVTMKLTDCASTVYSTTTTDGNGNYSLSTAGVSTGNVCIEETNTAGYLSTGASVTAGGAYSRTTDKITFALTADTSYSGMNFGDVPANQFLTDGSKTGMPGTTVSYPHTFIAGSGGTVTFSLATSTSSPVIAAWNEVLYTDTDCDGVLDSGTGETTTPATAITVVEGQKICLIQKEFIPAGTPLGASNIAPVTADFVYTNASPALTASYTRQDVTKVTNVALDLRKDVRNLTTPTVPVWKTSNTAKSAETLEYRITYTNNGLTAINDLVVNDATPAYTTFISASAPADASLPNNLTACQKVTPFLVAATTCTAAETPTGTGKGAIKWTFTGSLAPGSSGTVTFKVKVD